MTHDPSLTQPLFKADAFLRALALLLVVLLPFDTTWAQEEPRGSEAEAEDSESYIPVDLDDAIRHLKETLPPEDIEFLRTADDRELAGLHFGLGMGLRNGWGLWGGSRLAEWFNSISIFHPDDMSGIIIDSLVRDLRGEPRDLDAQVAVYVKYWEATEEYERQEELEELEREERRDRDRLDWQWTEDAAPEVTLPRRPDWQEVWGLYKYAGGFLIVTKRYRRTANHIWHDGIYFLDSPEGNLERVEVNGCFYQHDVVVQDESAVWLCRSMHNAWTLITTSPGTPDVRRQVELETEHDWLRIGIGESGLLLVSADQIYRESTAGWEVIYQAKSAVRDYNLFDQDDDFDPEDNPEPFLPHRSAAPIEHGGYLYFLVEEPGNETDLYRLPLNDEEGDLENAQEFISGVYFGNWSFRVGDLRVDGHGALWIASHRLGVLFSVGADGKVGVASFHNNLTFNGPIGELKGPEDWRENLPTGAILHDDGSIILAGVDGIARVKDDKVSPIVRFAYPDGMDRLPYTSRPQYDYHVNPQRLGMFDDGSFVIGDRYDGVYILVSEEDGYRIRLPAVMQTTRQMGGTADER